ncbi:paralemmin-3 [Lepus europaeus]|uniref:paralemmin-3 n=1 Tax=Lepus europaeus TaxID=9983 RepID=UPI002B46B82E|nr:paralemmin-3 [Lepus europaeus]
MALQSQLWSLATLMPMAESSLYRQRLEVIAEKRRLQEEIRAARRELEEEKLRVERLKRQSLRNHWLMDGAPAEGPEDPASQDPQSPAGQAQARIQTLEDSLFTLQSELQLLQSASTGAQHKPSGRPTWRRQDHRPLSQPPMDTGLAGQAVVDRRASLPGGPLAVSPDAPASLEPREDAAGVPEANGPCRSPSLEAPAKGTGVEPNGEGVVRVVWEGLRATEDSATGATGPELEAKVEQVVLEAMADRPGPCSPELPAWARADRGAVEVVWEGVGGSDPEASLRLQEGVEGAGAPRGSSAEGEGHRDSTGEEGSFIWVERVTLSEEWEELQVEGLEGPAGAGAHREGGEDSWAVERRRAEREGSRDRPGTEGTGVEGLLEPRRSGSGEQLQGEEPLGAGRSGGEKTQGAEVDLNPDQRGARAGSKAQAEEVREAGAPLQGEEEPGQQPQERQESSLEEEEAAKPLPSAAEGPASAGDPTALLTETPAPEQPAERQPLLPREGPSTRPVPTYAPARQPEPPARREGEGASGPKQKTCQCCSVM